MASKRVTLGLGVAALVALAGLLWLVQDGGSDRSSRSKSAPDADVDRMVDRQGENAPGEGSVADERQLADLIEKYGGFASVGRVLLTRPDAPGNGLEVKLRGSVDGLIVERETATDATGRFALAEVPRVPGYVLSIESPRTQSLRLDAETPDESKKRIDFGDLKVDRYYFVTGKVVEGSHPLAEVAVALTRPNGGRSFSFRGATASGVESDPVEAETLTDESGLFSLRLTEPGIYTLRATLDGYATHYRSEVVVGAGDAIVNVGLTQGFEVVGYVLDEAGRPVSEAGVALNAMMMGRGWNSAKEVTSTDGMGRFGFRIEPASARYMVRVVPGGGLDLMRMIEVPLADELVVRLPGSGVITGRVVDADTRQPVAGAEVLIALAAGSGQRMWMPDFSKALTTDDQGVYRVTGVGESSLQSIAVRAEGFKQVNATGRWGNAPELWKRLANLKISPDGETSIPEIRLERGRSLSGVIRDSRDNKPVPGASVELWDMVMGNRATVTGEDGSYRFDSVGDRVSMVVGAPGYASFRDAPFGGGFDLSEQEGEARRDVELQSGGTIEGSVRTGTGQPVSGALVRLRADTSGRRGWFAAMNLRDLWTFTNAKGEFRLSGVPPMKLQTEVEAQGYDLGHSRMREIKAGDVRKDMDVVLLPAAGMEGRVVDRSGDPVAGARVTVARDPGPDADPRAQWRALAMGKTAFAGKNGRFVLDEIPTGDVLVRVEADGLAVLTEARKGVEAGSRVRNVNLEMSPALSITGKVVNAQGEPITWAWVRAQRTDSSEGEGMLGARLEADGSFRITNVAQGNYRIVVNVRNFMPNTPRYANLTMENIAAGTQNLRLVLEPAEDPGR